VTTGRFLRGDAVSAGGFEDRDSIRTVETGKVAGSRSPTPPDDSPIAQLGVRRSAPPGPAGPARTSASCGLDVSVGRDRRWCQPCGMRSLTG